jgi:hypothetical protein
MIGAFHLSRVRMSACVGVRNRTHTLPTLFSNRVMFCGVIGKIGHPSYCRLWGILKTHLGRPNIYQVGSVIDLYRSSVSMTYQTRDRNNDD